jgi:uroporphyrinogen decarboxylase
LENSKYPFIEACFGRPHPHVPIWMMRQAGRFLPEYRAVREKHTFQEMCLTPEVAAEVTLQPVRRFGMDAAILFSDILTILPGMGLEIDFPGGGPQVINKIESAADVDKLIPLVPEEAIPQVYEAVRICRSELDGKTPLIGFCGAPFTLACYAIEGKGSKDWSNVKAFMYSQPEAAASLLDKLADAAAAHLKAKVDAGAQAVQIFDSWAGVLNKVDFDKYSKPYIKKIVDSIKPTGVPVIVFARGVPPEWQTGIDANVFSLDWRTPLRESHKTLQPAGVQGNLDPACLLAPPEIAVNQTKKILEEMKDVDGYIYNLGHGVTPKTPVDTVKAVVDTVHQFNNG